MGYYDDRKQLEDMGIGLAIFVLLIPVIPAGDVGLYFAKQISAKPTIILLIICWTGFIVLYAKFLLYITEEFLYSLHKTIVIFLVYLQGIIFASKLNGTEADIFSSIVIKFVTVVFNFLTSTV